MDIRRIRDSQNRPSVFIKEHKFAAFAGVSALLFAILLLVLYITSHVFNPFGLNKDMSGSYEANSLSSTQFSYSASHSGTLPYKDGAIVYSPSYLSFFDRSGKCGWEISIPIKNPIVKVCKSYIIAAENGGKSFCVIKNGDVVYRGESEYNILNADVSQHGKILLIEDETYYKAMAVVYSKKGEELYRWHSASSYVIDCAFSEYDSHFALTTLTASIAQTQAETGTFSSSVMIFSIYDEDVKNAKTVDGDIFTALYSSKRRFVALSSSSLSCFSSDAKLLWEYNLGGLKPLYVDSYNNRSALILSDESANQTLVIVNSNGEETGRATSLENVNGISMGLYAVGLHCSDGIRLYNTKAVCEYIVEPPRTCSDFCIFYDGQYQIGISNTTIEVFTRRKG